MSTTPLGISQVLWAIVALVLAYIAFAAFYEAFAIYEIVTVRGIASIILGVIFTLLAVGAFKRSEIDTPQLARFGYIVTAYRIRAVIAAVLIVGIIYIIGLKLIAAIAAVLLLSVMLLFY